MDDCLIRKSVMETYTGIYFDLAAPEVSMVCLEDIAHHLSIENRYCGASRLPLSVAQHSILVSQQFTNPIERAFALLHDAHEAYCKDIHRPLKVFLKELTTAYTEIADKVQAVIEEALLPKEWHRVIAESGLNYKSRLKTIDNAVCRAESTKLMCSRGAGWHWNGTPILDLEFEVSPAWKAECEFTAEWLKIIQC